MILFAVIQQLNLSSRPFRNRTLPWILSAVLLGVSVIAAFFVLVEYQKVTTQTAAIKKEIGKVEPEIAALKRQSEQIRQSLTPEQQQLLTGAHLLVARKQFSWSRLFGDLERVLPGDVSVSSITIRDVYQSNTQNERKTLAELDFAVVGRDYQSIMTMINNMNGTGIFQAELRGQDLQRDKGTLSEYTMHLIYSPRSGVTVSPETQMGATTAANNLNLVGMKIAQ